MELYATIAKERPSQILAIFIRDARPPGATPLEDPTGRLARTYMPWYSSRSSWSSGSSGEPTLPTLSPLSPQPRTPTSAGFSLPPDASTQTIKARPSRPRPGPRSPTMDSMQDYLTSPRFFKPRPRPPRSPSLPTPRTSSDINSSTAFNSTIVSESPLPSPSTTPPRTTSPIRSSSTQQQESLSFLEKKSSELQVRVWKAKLVIPDHIKFRVFREPEDCVEANEILDKIIPL